MKTCPKCNELIGDSAENCFNCHYNFKFGRVLNQTEKNNIERLKQEEKNNIERLKQEEKNRLIEIEKTRINSESEIREMNSEYEYIVVSLNDSKCGNLDIDRLSFILNEKAKQGWRLKNVLSNEIGVNSSSFGYGGISTGTNATIDQNILIFERMVRQGKQINKE